MTTGNTNAQYKVIMLREILSAPKAVDINDRSMHSISITVINPKEKRLSVNVLLLYLSTTSAFGSEAELEVTKYDVFGSTLCLLRT